MNVLTASPDPKSLHGGNNPPRSATLVHLLRSATVALVGLCLGGAATSSLGQPATTGPIPATLRCSAHSINPVRLPAYDASLTFAREGTRFVATRVTQSRPGHEIFEVFFRTDGRVQISGSGSFDNGGRWRWAFDGVAQGDRTVLVGGLYEPGRNGVEYARRSCNIELMLPPPISPAPEAVISDSKKAPAASADAPLAGATSPTPAQPIPTHSGWVTLKNLEIVGGDMIFRKYSFLRDGTDIPIRNLILYTCRLAKESSYLTIIVPKNFTTRSFPVESWLPRIDVRILINGQSSLGMTGEYRNREFYFDFTSENEEDFRAILGANSLGLGFGKENDILEFEFTDKVDAAFSEVAPKLYGEQGPLTLYSKQQVQEACNQFRRARTVGQAPAKSTVLSANDCRKLVEFHGLLSRAQFQCKFGRYSQSMIEAASRCHSITGEEASKGALLAGMRKFDDGERTLGRRGACAKLLRDNPQMIAR